MSAYFQMGHNSENLIGDTDLETYKGIVLSPVNRNNEELPKDLLKFRSIDSSLDIVLDPQLYLPQHVRGALGSHPYFPLDIATADPSSTAWWSSLALGVADYGIKLDVTTICSPSIIPNRWSDEFYEMSNFVTNELSTHIAGRKKCYQTLAVSLSELADKSQVYRIASIVSNSICDGYYIVIYTDVEPRRELSNVDQIAGSLLLIYLLKTTGKKIFVSHTSSDMVLFKAAGADHCATGKYFNLKRFTKSRFDKPPAGGGGLVAYWFEHSLFAFLRGADIARLSSRGYSTLINKGPQPNLWANVILDQFNTDPKSAWVALGWKQYLSWFCKAELRLTTESDPKSVVKQWLLDAEDNWSMLNGNDLLFDERPNDGHWIRAWRQTISDFEFEITE